jgi:hypothetical protein
VLANGVEIGVYRVSDDALMVDLTDGMPITHNTEWARLTFDVRADNYGAGDRFVSAHLCFLGTGLPLMLSEKEYLAVTVNDNLSTLNHHMFTAHGHITKIPQP